MAKYICKKTLLAVFIIFCITVTLFYMFGSYPRYDYDFFKGATSAYSTSGFFNSEFEREFEGKELEIMLNWAKTIEPTGKADNIIICASPCLHFRNGERTASVDPYASNDILVLYDGAVYHAVCDAELLTRVNDILAYYNTLSFFKKADHYYGDMDISHNGSEKEDVFNRELSTLGFGIGDAILSKKPAHYDIPQPVNRYEYTDLHTLWAHYIRIYHDGDSVLPTVILFNGDRPIFEFELNEDEIKSVGRINELTEKYFG